MRDSFTQLRARRLRRNLTATEQHLWKFLRRRYLNGHRFRRQMPVGPYVVDFACLSARLVVELDGAHHALERAADERREQFLQANGFRILRFWDNEVLQQTDAVLTVILAALPEPPT